MRSGSGKIEATREGIANVFANFYKCQYASKNDERTDEKDSEARLENTCDHVDDDIEDDEQDRHIQEFTMKELIIDDCNRQSQDRETCGQ